MIGMLTALMSLSGQAAAPTATDPTASSKVDSVTITAPGQKSAPPPKWSTRIEGIGWPYLGVGQDKSIITFAKTGKTPVGQPWQRVWVRHEFRAPRSEAGLTYRSERMAQDVDCTARAFRSLAVYRYPENNLKGAETAYAFEDRQWTQPEPGAFEESVVEAACMKPLAG
ncbi:surface-adhesin E family protein [Caulobacter sp. 1776]|uniref:surface-adhesin E family protein n=1 Tax=Caulobacter sp. 1776 TaxID=3156420 RepID=UPI00339909E3